MSSSTRRWPILSADVLALLVFTVIGLVNHEGGVTIKGVLEVVVPIVAVGAAMALLFDTYRRPELRTLLPTWLISVPGGILIRKGLFHTPSTWGSTAIFIGVALGFTLIFLLLGRLAVSFLLGLLSGRKHKGRDELRV